MLFGSLILINLSFSPTLFAKIYQSQSEFIAIQLTDNQEYSFKSQTLWLKNKLQNEIKSILNHKYPKLRLRYKMSNNKNEPTTIWFLDEIGKEREISFAVSVKNDQIQMIRVLEFRESRGYEIHIPAFTQQFEKLALNKEKRLNQTIDGITGATMSVNAMKKIARVALTLHEHVLNKRSN